MYLTTQVFAEIKAVYPLAVLSCKRGKPGSNPNQHNNYTSEPLHYHLFSYSVFL